MIILRAYIVVKKIKTENPVYLYEDFACAMI